MGLILSIFLGIVLLYVIKGLIVVNRARNQFKQMFGQQPETASGNRQPNERKAGWTAPLRRKKKIDPQVGEYVEFTETVTSSANQNDRHQNQTRQSGRQSAENQVSDAEWEDLPR
jgi:hypothetical protein